MVFEATKGTKGGSADREATREICGAEVMASNKEESLLFCGAQRKFILARPCHGD